MSNKPKKHKAMGEGEWMARLRAYASSGVWPPGGNRPAPKQRKWHDLYQNIEKCPMQARGQTTLFGGSLACNCGFHSAKQPTTQPPAAAAQSAASVSAPGAMAAVTPSFLHPPASLSMITKKLAGHGKGTGLWVTSIGNEVGQIVTCVVTVQEGPGLDRMVAGVMERYRQAAIAPPLLLYVDCGCCISEGSSKLQTRFGEWPDLHIRLDIWHLMRRLAVGCTTDAHPLYPTFMGCLSACIFEWDAGDLSLLRRAKREQLEREGVPALTDAAVDARIGKRELSQYCRRRTRGEEATISLIGRLLQELGGANGRDLMGVPLLDQVRMEHMWRVQQRHIKCIQDLPGVQLYTEKGTINKGGVVLTRYRCARGSTSLESFHCHLNRFIPGTSANALNFQLYLLEGLNRWNQDRGTAAVPAAVSSRPSSLLTYTYSGDVTQCVNTNSFKVLGRAFVPTFRPPSKYTGELLGIDYLLSQTGQPLQVNPDSEEAENMLEDVAEGEEEDEGFEEDQTPDLTVPGLLDDWDVP
ncbi:unnamed protein product [Merluccius merluccius]